MIARVHEGFVEGDAGCRQGLPVSLDAFAGGVDRTGAEEGDATVAALDEQVHSPPDSADIVGDDRIDVSSDGGAVEAHDRRPAGDDRAEVRLIDRRGYDQQGHDAPLDHRRDDLGLAVGAITRRCRQDEAVATADHGLDAL